jgi:hypothetical protein
VDKIKIDLEVNKVNVRVDWIQIAQDRVNLLFLSRHKKFGLHVRWGIF